MQLEKENFPIGEVKKGFYNFIVVISKNRFVLKLLVERKKMQPVHLKKCIYKNCNYVIYVVNQEVFWLNKK